MRRDELAELHYITSLENIASILHKGILCYREASKVEHTSVAMQEIQDRRKLVTVPKGQKLHDYANLYFHARNPMMYKRKANHESLGVLRVSTGVLDLPGVVITDGNAAGEYIRFAAAPDGLEIVSQELTFSRNWNSSDPVKYYRQKCAKCAEVLVPNVVNPGFIGGLYVSAQSVATKLKTAGMKLGVTVNPDLFFNRASHG